MGCPASSTLLYTAVAESILGALRDVSFTRLNVLFTSCPRSVQLHKDTHPVGSAPNFPFVCLPLVLSCFTLVSHLQPVSQNCVTLGLSLRSPFLPSVLHPCIPLFAANATLPNHLHTDSPSNHFLRWFQLWIAFFLHAPTSPSGSHPGILVFPLGVAVILRLANCAPPKSHSYSTYSTYCAAPPC